jgi:hypothetical protein
MRLIDAKRARQHVWTPNFGIRELKRPFQNFQQFTSFPVLVPVATEKTSRGQQHNHKCIA